MEAGPSTLRVDAMDVDQPNGLTRSSPKVSPAPSAHDATQSVGFVFSSEMGIHYSTLNHDHPECPERIVGIYEMLHSEGCIRRMRKIPIRAVRKEEATLVHSEHHWDRVMALQHISSQDVVDSEMFYDQLSLYVMEGTTRAALLSCGGVIEACLAVASSENQTMKSIAIVRPPGHHAEPEEHMGFCFFNNVAVAAKVVQQTTPIKRILILDWDIHHGNGTQRAFNDDPSILYISIHRYEDGDFYPTGDFGGMESCGTGDGLGFSVNIPWPCSDMTDADYLYAFQAIVMPIAVEFSPELVIISAGFDAAEGDELGECHVSPAGYANMTHMLAGLAGGRLVVALEGGYNIDAISRSALAVTEVLLGEAPAELPPLRASSEATETIWQVSRVQSKFWKNVTAHAIEPPLHNSNLTVSVMDVLKAHRQHYLYTNHGLLDVPIVKEDLSQRFASQVMCTPDLLVNKTLVVFVHEFGNLRAELQSSMSCDLNLERSYLINISKAVTDWAKQSGYSLLDVNLFPKPLEGHGAASRSMLRQKAAGGLGSEIMLHIWDNYISVSKAQNIVFIGNGLGCPPMMKCLNKRWGTPEQSKIKLIVQILGMSNSAILPKSDDFIHWYSEHSLLVLPSVHSLSHPSHRDKQIKRHGGLLEIEDAYEPAKVMLKALTAIQAWVRAALEGLI